MSENIPTVSAPSATQLHHKKSKKKYDKNRLPTPPPDPNDSKSDDRAEFLAYLDQLGKCNVAYSRSTSVFAPAIATEDAFDHLEKLYKLMEQMLELREQNAKLHRRIRDLEHLNNLEKMHKQLDLTNIEIECPELDKDTAFAETILESILSDTKSPKTKPSASTRLHHSIYRKTRNRSGSISVSTEKSHFEPLSSEGTKDRRASTCVDSRIKKPAKVSKWTKVKAVLKWEKACPTVSDAKSQDSGIGGSMIPVNLEVARYLRVPSTSEDLGHSPADSGAAEISTPGTLSSVSSTEDFHRNELRSPCEDLRSSDDENSHYIPQSKDGSQKSSKCHKTPWAKMKDIIQTRNSFKKKHRLSAHSDEVQIDVELCSDNEDVFEDEDKTQKSSNEISTVVYKRENSDEVPREIIERYQQVVAGDGTISDAKKISKWTRVKKAFLSPYEETDQTNKTTADSKCEDESNVIHDEIQKNYKQLQKKLSLEFQEKLSEWERLKQNSPGTSNPSSSCGFVDEAKDPTFMKKIEEWQKLKSHPSTKTRSPIQMTSEENLPPEFKKKLQEWEKIRKTSSKKKLGEAPRWKSLGGRSENQPAFEYPQISEDFKKKLEEWRQIKSGACAIQNEDSERKSNMKLSPRLNRKNSSPKHYKKHKDSHAKELQWFEKELTKIEKEKQRLERERQKFLEREERLSKLRSSVVGGPKKEVVIHMPSGFYRFEGISRKFTQKLYEWEKAQGIGPESSTFALLKSSLTQDMKAHLKDKSPGSTPPLTRSKSADSIAISALNMACPLISHQPSSLSLNDVEDLEKECLADSKSSSTQFFSSHSHETLPNEEPEALIVEVEDVVEETAAPLHAYAQKIQQPVYQREELKAMCEGETCIGPKVRRSESARAQNNYNLIEEIFSILKNLTENEFEILRVQDSLTDQEKKPNTHLIRLKMFDESQKAMSSRLNDKVMKLQEANNHVFNSISQEATESQNKHVLEVLEIVQDLSSEVINLTERLDVELSNRNVYHITHDEGARSLNPIMEISKDIRSKMLELRRRLSYVCAASDLTAPRRKHSNKKKKSVRKTISNESTESKIDTTSDVSRAGSERIAREGRLYIKSDTYNTQSQGAIKKRIRYRQKSLQNRTLLDTDEEDESSNEKRSLHKKLCRTRSVSESSVGKIDDFKHKKEKVKSNKSEEIVVVDESLVEKVLVQTQPNFVNITQPKTQADSEASDSPVTVFVKTTRKLFTPIVESTLIERAKEESLAKIAETNIPGTDSHEYQPVNEYVTAKNKNESCSKIPVTHLPPLPASPTPQRKLYKDISPSIKIMLAKYNQKISEHDIANIKSGGSSGSASPVAWRSPTAERRVKAQTQRYQEELKKLSPLLGGRREVQKSASVGFLHSSNKQITVPQRDSVQEENHNISKSSSTSLIQMRKLDFPPDNKHQKACQENRRATLSVVIDSDNSEATARHSLEIRQMKLQKAKEEFLKYSPPPPNSAPAQIHSHDEPLKFPDRNRLSQISVGSESSYGSACAGALIKSASAGMINIDAEVYRQIDPEVHGGGYVSLPRYIKKQKEGFLSGKFAFSNIASKFRKVRMRKGKDKETSKMNAVSTLCRQSLVVDINRLLTPNDNKHEAAATSAESRDISSEDVSSSSSKTGLWMKRPKLFK